jgi:putative membrane protein
MINGRSLAGAALILLLGLAGLAPASAQESAASARPSQDYVTKAAIGDLFEIQSSKLALRKSRDGEAKSFASRMIKDHAASSAAMKRIIKAEELPLQPPAKLDDAHQQMIDSLSAANGSDFDKIYWDMQSKAHEEALAMHQGYAESGLEPKLKAFEEDQRDRPEAYRDVEEWASLYVAVGSNDCLRAFARHKTRGAQCRALR